MIAKGQLVVLESTTFPGTTRDHLVPLLEESGLVAGEDFALAFSPERVDPGRTDYTIANTPKIVGGLTEACTARALDVYGRDLRRAGPRLHARGGGDGEAAGEHLPLASTSRWSTSSRCSPTGCGSTSGRSSTRPSTKPFGFMRFEPGPGMGGHCLPVDPFYLTWKAREYDMVTEFIELAGKVNKQMPYFCIEKIERALNEAGQPVKDARILVVGVSYKAGVGDLREAPALKIIELLRERGGDVRYHDPHVPELPQFGLRSTEPGDCDLAVIVTAHPGVDHGAVIDVAPSVLDLRGVTRARRDAKVRQL